MMSLYLFVSIRKEDDPTLIMWLGYSECLKLKSETKVLFRKVFM